MDATAAPVSLPIIQQLLRTAEKEAPFDEKIMIFAACFYSFRNINLDILWLPAHEEELDMTVYGDAVFLLNGCIDLLLLWLTMAIRKQKTAFWRLILAACLGALYAVMMVVPVMPWLFTWAGKWLFSCVMVFVAFGYQSRTAFLRNWGVFYLVSFAVGGGMFALHYLLLERREILNGLLVSQSGGMGTPLTWGFIVIAFPLVWWYSRSTFRSLEERQTVHRYLVQVEVTLGSRHVRGTGLIDTGNQLRDPLTRAPVMMAEANLVEAMLPPELQKAMKHADPAQAFAEIPHAWISRIKLIPYRSVRRGTDFLLAVKADKMKVVQDGRAYELTKVLIGLDSGKLSADGSYQMIVHPSIVEEAS